jgi:aryl-alcohol dehydrogenase-like predicted oxidoreductase
LKSAAFTPETAGRGSGARFISNRAVFGRVKQRRLGKTGLKVSTIGFGAWGIGGNEHGNSYGPTDDEESRRAVRRALDLGCTFFDTADVYGWGHSERLLGETLQGRRDDVVIATKVGGDFYHGGVRLNFSPEYVRFAVQKSLERLQTDHIDVYQLHNPPPEYLAERETFRVLRELRDEGKIRHFGVSIHDPAEGALAMKTDPTLGALQVVYNLVHREPESELLPTCRSREVGVIAREPLWNSFLAGKYQGDESFPPGDIRSSWPAPYLKERAALADGLRKRLADQDRTLAQAALAFAVARSEVSSVIPGCKTVAQVEENMAAADKPWSRDDEEAVQAVISA